MVTDSTEKMIKEFKRIGGDDVVTTYDFMVISSNFIMRPNEFLYSGST